MYGDFGCAGVESCDHVVGVETDIVFEDDAEVGGGESAVDGVDDILPLSEVWRDVFVASTRLSHFKHDSGCVAFVKSLAEGYHDG